jgi:hypothetical protein
MLYTMKVADSEILLNNKKKLINTTWMHLQNIMPSKRHQSQKVILWFHLYDIPEEAKHQDEELSRGCQLGSKESLTAKGLLSQFGHMKFWLEKWQGYFPCFLEALFFKKKKEKKKARGWWTTPVI